MSDNVTVSYNGFLLSPPPFVSRTESPIDYGHRWGVTDEIALKGLYFISESGTGIISEFVNIFSGQFAELKVQNEVAGNVFTILSYPNVILEEFSFDSDHFYPNTYVPYSAKFKSINVPSGVIEPVNEYSFAQNEDGTVSVNHKVSAKGVVTSSLYDSALQNAKTFVQSFTGQTPFNPIFVSVGQPVLLNQSENIDRLTASYGISETYKYNSGEFLDYIHMSNVDIDLSNDADFRIINLTYNVHGSSVTGKIDSLRAEFQNINPLGILQDSYGLSTGNFHINSFGVVEDSGRNSIQLTANVISGVGDEWTGFFDYDIDLKWDKVQNVRTFSINGKFMSKAPVSQRRTYLANFKAANNPFKQYLYNVVTGSQVYASYGGSSYPLNPIPTAFSINENTGLAEFSVTASYGDRDFISGISEASFLINVEPPRNLYEFKPASNIEGFYVIQDLQTVTRENLKMSCSAKTTGDVVQGISGVNSVLSNFSGVLLNSFFLVDNSFETGVFDVSANATLLNNGTKFGITGEHYFSSPAPSLRPAGFKWGR